MTVSDIERKFRGLNHLVGNTPLLAISCRYRGQRRTIYAKAPSIESSDC